MLLKISLPYKLVLRLQNEIDHYLNVEDSMMITF